MGVDIHMFVVKDKEVLKEDIFEGRNSQWFNNLQGSYVTDLAYDHLPVKRSWKEECGIPNELITEYKKEDCYYGHRMIRVSDYINWFNKYKPDLTAGWVTKYDAWAYYNKGIVPKDIYHNLKEADLASEDAVFIEIKLNGCATWLCEYLTNVKNGIPCDAYVIYCFDC